MTLEMGAHFLIENFEDPEMLTEVSYSSRGQQWEQTTLPSFREDKSARVIVGHVDAGQIARLQVS